MERPRWTQIESILRSALDQPAEGRAEFVSVACGGDAALRREVESFLESHDSSDGFLETPAIVVAARSLAAEKVSLIGAMIGPYRILKAIGAGGMGEVFLAQDTRLDRSIAVKILPAEFAADAGRVQRFEQEARAAGALNHPNVLVVHDTGVHQGVPYIAAEYLQGETLRERLNRGALPVDKALDFAGQMARALAAAHEHGIVHRDLKPENVFVTREGRIKILDFGIAKLMEPHARAQETLTSPGAVIGTVGYLSPEQVRGLAAGPSSDLFAFGCVFYEMLTGQRAFSKESSAETMTAIVREEPAEAAVLSTLPDGVLRTLRHCLEKSATERFQSAWDLAFTLETLRVPSRKGAESVAPSRKQLPLAWLLAALFGIAAAVMWVLIMTRKAPDQALLRFEIPVPGDPVTGSPAVAISPDGTQVAFMAMGSKGKPVLWTRAMNTISPVPVAGSEDARYPFWSADSRFLGFQVGDKIRALNSATGHERTICTMRGIVNATWNAEGIIVASTGNGPLLRLSVDGGSSTPLTSLNAAAGQRSHWWPSFLPDNRHFLYTVNASTLDKSGVFVGSLDSAETKLLVSGVITNAAFVPAGYLLYSREGNLISRHFDAKSLEVSGPEVTIVEKLKAYYGYRAFSTSQTGTLVFRAGDQSRYQLAWYDRRGKRLAPVEDEAEKKWSEGILPLAPTLSPDGTQLATVQFQPSNGSYGIWVSALNRANLEFPVTETRNAEYATWSPDGSRIAYSASPNGGARDLYVKRLDETGNGQLVYHSATDKWPLDWSSDGQTLLVMQEDERGQSSLWSANIGETAKPVVMKVPGVAADVKQARFSPDGRWLAYSSDQSGSSLVYVQDFPKGGMRLPISGKGATDPQWRHDGRELFYLSAQKELMSVDIVEDSGGGLSAGTPKILFTTAVTGVNPYTVTPDGQRFLVQMPTEDTTTPVISVMANRFVAR